jgi:hypothetical protein
MTDKKIWHDRNKEVPEIQKPVLMQAEDFWGKPITRVGSWNGMWFCNTNADFKVKRWAYIEDIINLD